MNESLKTIPSPRNPYGMGMILLGLLMVVGVLLILGSGIGSSGPPVIGMLLPGIMLVTMAGIFCLAAAYGWRGFEKRFGRDCLLGYWEVGGTNWRRHLEGEKKKMWKLGLVGGLGLPGVILGVILVMAHSDGDLENVLPIALMVSGGIAVLVLVLVFLQWLALTGNRGCVWLTKRGVLVNRVVFFIDGSGIQTVSRELRHQDGKYDLIICYMIQMRHGWVDKELVVPVPEENVELVEGTIEEWDRRLPS